MGEYMQQSIKYGKKKYGSAMTFWNEILSGSLRINVWFHMIKIACSVGEYMQESTKAGSILEITFLDRER